MALEMRDRCERCAGGLFANGEAYIRSYGCSFCRACHGTPEATCPNCGG